MLERGDVDAARAVLEPLANTGDREAAFRLAESYESGGQPAAAFDWYKRAAARGHVEATWRVARMFESGGGAEANLTNAAAYYRKAADQGHAAAQFRYGEMLESGSGLARDRKGALDWYLKAARQGNVAAKTKVGKFNLYGIAKKPNFLEARRWLHEAAEAGDEEAQALIDSLARSKRAALRLPGTSRPTDPAARRVLDEVEDLIRPMLDAPPGTTKLVLAQAPTVAPIAEGHLVTLPLVEFQGPLAALRLGTIQVEFRPDGDDWAVAARLPERWRVTGPGGQEMASIAIGRQSVSGRWSAALRTVTDYEAEFGGMRVDSGLLPLALRVETVRGQRGVAKRDDGRYDVAETIDVRGASIENRAGMPFQALDVGTLAVAASYTGLDLGAIARLARHFGIDWRTGAEIRAVEAAGAPPQVPPMLRDIRFSARVADVSARGAGGAVIGGLKAGEAILTGTKLDGALGAVTASYAHDGFSADGDEAAPRTARLRLSADRVPLPRLVAAGVSGLLGGLEERDAGWSAILPEAEAAFVQALRDAKTEFRIDEAVVAGDAYDLRAKGVLQPVRDGVAAALEVRVRGLDALARAGHVGLPLLDGLTADDVARLRELAVVEKDGDGRPVETYRVALLPNGDVKVNGKDATARLAESR